MKEILGKLGLDELDVEILNRIQEDVHFERDELVKYWEEKTGKKIAKTTISERIRKLRKSGIIKKEIGIVDSEQLGKGVVLFILIKEETVKHKDIINKLKELEMIQELYSITGEYDAIVKLRVKDVGDIGKSLKEIFNIEGIIETQACVVFETHVEKTKLELK